MVHKVRHSIYTEKRNSVFCIGGRPGTGKSYSTATILKSIDPTFHVNRVFYSVEEVAKFVSSNPKRGSAFMLDEAGVAINYRRWYNKENEKMMDMLQTWRHKGLVCAMIAPSKKLLDKVSHDFFDFIFDTEKVYHSQGFTKIRVVVPELNRLIDKLYQKYPQVSVKLGEFRRAKIKSIYVGHPGRNFSVPYEKMKKAFTSQLNEKNYNDLEGTNSKVDEDQTVKRLSFQQEKAYKLLWQGKNRTEIAKEMNISIGSIATLLRNARLKGHPLPPRGYKPKNQNEEDLRPRSGESVIAPPSWIKEDEECH